MSIYRKYVKILIIGRVAWTKGQSTLNSIFNGFSPEQLAYICIETQDPDFSRCANHFQISEIALIKRLFKWNTLTGHKRFSGANSSEEKSLEKKEATTGGWIRKHRSPLFLYIRELLWHLNGWKTKELDQFIEDFAPDVLFFLSDPLPLMNRLQRFVLNKTKLPAAIFLMDDIWSYESGRSGLRYLLRQEVKKLVPACEAHFAISPKMKEECDQLFNTQCILLTKGIENYAEPLLHVHSPITLVYTGNLIYGRLYSLAAIANTVERINATTGDKVLLKIYTQTELEDKDRALLDKPGISQLCPPVPYAELENIYKASDILLFVESLQERYKNIARLSFSTKLTDYLACGRCIFAVGADDIAPIEYLRDADIAITCSSIKEIDSKLQALLENPERITSLANKSLEYGKIHHNTELMHERLSSTIIRIANKFANGNSTLG